MDRLGQISCLDCVVFVTLLIPQLVLRVAWFELLSCAIKLLPFIFIRMPLALVVERYLSRKSERSPFVREASLFQDLVIRCVRFAFANMPASVGKIFFSRNVALPFFNFRRLRHGFFRSTVHWEEVQKDTFQGLWLTHDPNREPDIVVYYMHGGGFSMGSSFFYLEFLMAWVSLLKKAGYQNPALFALEYSLVPDEVYPRQVFQARAGYNFVLSKVMDSAQICVSGDSAGATLMLSMLLSLTRRTEDHARLPSLAVAISPWVKILSPKNRNTRIDYLDARTLDLYGRQYIGNGDSNDPLISPGCCRDADWWSRASPTHGWYFVYGSEEVLAPETRDLIRLLLVSGQEVQIREDFAWPHAWPIVKHYLCKSQAERHHGLQDIIDFIAQRIDQSTE